jgi:hypothetical protein
MRGRVTGPAEPTRMTQSRDNRMRRHRFFFPQSARNETMKEVRCRSLTTREVGRLSVIPMGGERWEILSFAYK